MSRGQACSAVAAGEVQRAGGTRPASLFLTPDRGVGTPWEGAGASRCSCVRVSSWLHLLCFGYRHFQPFGIVVILVN